MSGKYHLLFGPFVLDLILLVVKWLILCLVDEKEDEGMG